MRMFSGLLTAVFQKPQVWLSHIKPDPNDKRTIYELSHDLLSSRGEVSGFSLAQKILSRYATMPEQEKAAFFKFLTEELDISHTDVRTALAHYQNQPDKVNYRAFMEAAEPRRQELIRRLNQVPNATGQLVTMRNDLLKFKQGNARLAVLDLDFRHLLASWFNRGFLVLQPISWESPADILEKIIQYEAVHEITSWSDLRRRLRPEDRRCFAYFHPTMPNEPLIFVEVALTVGIPSSIQSVLSEDREMLIPEKADAAVFYSISNCQPGLAGISFGNSLIKQVVRDLSQELPNLKHFVTLSPIPGFTRWLKKTGQTLNQDDTASVQAMAAHYLLSAKRSDGMPLDPVSRFHLGNGALIHAVHADADTSEKGIAESYGAMVNYLYDVPRIAANHERFATDKVVVAAPKVGSIADKAAVEAIIEPEPPNKAITKDRDMRVH